MEWGRAASLLHQVLAEVGCLLALHALFHLARLCGVSNHADRVVVADVLPEPVEQYHYLVLYAQAKKPWLWNLPSSTTALLRPMVAIEPRFL